MSIFYWTMLFISDKFNFIATFATTVPGWASTHPAHQSQANQTIRNLFIFFLSILNQLFLCLLFLSCFVLQSPGWLAIDLVLVCHLPIFYKNKFSKRCMFCTWLIQHCAAFFLKQWICGKFGMFFLRGI